MKLVKPIIAPVITKPRRHNAKSHSNGILLPSDRYARSASLAFENGSFAIAAKSVKSTDKERAQKNTPCQDTAFVIAKENYLVAGVADGFSTYGHEYSDLIAKRLLELDLAGMIEESRYGRKTPLSDILLGAIKETAGNVIAEFERSNLDRSYSGGTTVTLVLVLPNRTYAIAAVGDSDAYFIDRRGWIMRVIESEVLPSSSFEPDTPSGRFSLTKYLENRSILVHAISRLYGTGLGLGITLKNGVLAKGETLLIATDGLSKNLSIGIVNTEKQGVLAADGCKDLMRLLRRTTETNIQDALEHVIKAIRERIQNIRKDRVEFLTGDSQLEVLAPNDDDLTAVMVGVR